jgi:hypothetical protein
MLNFVSVRTIKGSSSPPRGVLAVLSEGKGARYRPPGQPGGGVRVGRFFGARPSSPRKELGPVTLDKHWGTQLGIYFSYSMLL